MNIEEVRGNFSKASIIVSPNRLSIVYGKWENRYSEEIDPTFLSNMIHESSCIILEDCDRSSIKITFCMETGETKNVIYPHMTDELTLEELQKACQPDPDTQYAIFDYLPDNCAELDFSELAPHILEYIKDRNKLAPDVHTTPQEWENVLSSALKFATSIGAESEIVEPDRITPGIVTVFALEEPRKSMRFSEKKKDILESAIRACHTVGLEIGSTEGILYFMFSTGYK